jgi:Zn-dependent protease
MYPIILLSGIVLVAFGAFKYMSINRKEPKFYKLAGLNISEEIIWIALFIIGFILMIAVAIHFLESQYAGRGTF